MAASTVVLHVIGMQVMLIASLQQPQRLSSSPNRQNLVSIDEQGRLLQSTGKDGRARPRWAISMEVPVSFATCAPKGAWSSPPWETNGVTVPSKGDLATMDVPFPGFGIPNDQVQATKKCRRYIKNDYEFLFKYKLTESNFFPAGYKGDLRVFLDGSNASRSFISYWASWPRDTFVTTAQTKLLEMTFQYWGFPADAPADSEQNAAAKAAGNNATTFRFGMILPHSFESCVPMMNWAAAPWDVEGDPEPTIGDERHYTGALPGFGVPDDTVKTTVECTAYESSDVYYMHGYVVTSSNFMPQDYAGTVEIYKDIANPSQIFAHYVATWPVAGDVSDAVKSLLEMSMQYICYR